MSLKETKMVKQVSSKQQLKKILLKPKYSLQASIEKGKHKASHSHTPLKYKKIVQLIPTDKAPAPIPHPNTIHNEK